jgi:hypothetical protein
MLRQRAFLEVLHRAVIAILRAEGVLRAAAGAALPRREQGDLLVLR